MSMKACKSLKTMCKVHGISTIPRMEVLGMVFIFAAQAYSWEAFRLRTQMVRFPNASRTCRVPHSYLISFRRRRTLWYRMKKDWAVFVGRCKFFLLTAVWDLSSSSFAGLMWDMYVFGKQYHTEFPCIIPLVDDSDVSTALRRASDLYSSSSSVRRRRGSSLGDTDRHFVARPPIC